MNRTTPLPLSSSSFFNVVVSPSLVWISPPKPSRSMTWPTATFLLDGAAAGGGEAAAAAGAAGFSSSFLAAGSGFLDLAGLPGLVAFFAAGAGAGGGCGALRLRSSTGMVVALCKAGDAGFKFKQEQMAWEGGRGVREV